MSPRPELVAPSEELADHLGRVRKVVAEIGAAVEELRRFLLAAARA